MTVRQYGQGVAEEVEAAKLEELGIKPALFEHVKPGQKDFAQIVIHLFETRGIKVAFYGGYPAEGGLIVRQTKARLPEFTFIMPDGVASEDFWLIAGDAAEGTRMTFYMDATRRPAAADVMAQI